MFRLGRYVRQTVWVKNAMNHQKNKVLFSHTSTNTSVVMSFGFGGDDPDVVGNLERQLNEMRIVTQNMQAENDMLKRQIKALTSPTDYALLVVKCFGS
jgi:hypothetical protein